MIYERMLNFPEPKALRFPNSSQVLYRERINLICAARRSTSSRSDMSSDFRIRSFCNIKLINVAEAWKCRRMDSQKDGSWLRDPASPLLTAGASSCNFLKNWKSSAAPAHPRGDRQSVAVYLGAKSFGFRFEPSELGLEVLLSLLQFALSYFLCKRDDNVRTQDGTGFRIKSNISLVVGSFRILYYKSICILWKKE